MVKDKSVKWLQKIQEKLLIIRKKLLISFLIDTWLNYIYYCRNYALNRYSNNLP